MDINIFWKIREVVDMRDTAGNLVITYGPRYNLCVPI